jgi:hypothetical protein
MPVRVSGCSLMSRLGPPPDRRRAELQSQIPRAALVELEDLRVEHDRRRNDVELSDHLFRRANALRAPGEDELLRPRGDEDVQVGVGSLQCLLDGLRDILRRRRRVLALLPAGQDGAQRDDLVS